MYFYNKLIWSHKYEYFSLETWSNVNYFFWHATHSCMLSWTEGVQIKHEDESRVVAACGVANWAEKHEHK
jgi:hypothetical protein